jgi:diguanylate cyclase (GGDEF)-like protein/PAS domain S-box-containing protein
VISTPLTSRTLLLASSALAAGLVLSGVLWPERAQATLLALVPVLIALGGLAWRIARSMAALERQADELRRARDALQAITDSLPARISRFDRNERVLFANRYCGEVYGCPVGQLLGRTVREVRGEAAYAVVQPQIARVLRGEHVRHEHVMTVDGEPRSFQQELIPEFADDGSVRGFCAISFDVTERRRTEDALTSSEQRLRDIADNLPVLISYIDREQRLQYANETFRRWLDANPQDAIGRPLVEVLGAAAMEERQPFLARALSGETVAFDATLLCAGTQRELHITYLPDADVDGTVRGVYALCSDVTPMKQVERRLDLLAREDPLTGLPNRREFDERLAAAMARCRRVARPLALLFLDVDKFKSVNDRLGHAAGDEVLRFFARQLCSVVRETDTVARLAGDEFVVILEGLQGADEASAVAQKLLDAVRAPMLLAGEALHLSGSLGLALYDGDDRTPARLLAQADQALYAAKEAGRNTWRRAVS